MAQNITLLGANYPDVPAVTLPVTGGGTATFSDTRSVTYNLSGGATASVNPSEVVAGQCFSVKLTAPTGYNLNNVTVTMGGVDITSQVFTPDEEGGGGGANLQTKSVSYTPTTSAQSAQVTADSGYDGLEQVNVLVGAIPSEYIIPTGTKSITANGTGIDVAQYASVDVAVSGASPVKTKTGTFTGNGTRTVDIPCDFEPDLIYWTSDPGTTASSGTVAGLIAREMMAVNRYRNNATSNLHTVAINITAMNTGGSSYNFRATYANSTVTLYCFSNNARSLFTNGRTYTYKFVKWTT